MKISKRAKKFLNSLKKLNPGAGTSKALLLAALLILGTGMLQLSGDHLPDYGVNTSGNINVTDGDTVDFSSEEFTGTVRLLGVDTPEISSSNNPEEFEGVPESLEARECLRKWGGKASDFLEERSGQSFRLETDPDADRRGDYGRLLGYIYTENSEKSVNLVLVEKGLGRMYDSDFSKMEEFREAEREAMDENHGVWNCRDL
jgi:micrococcal nuclease